MPFKVYMSEGGPFTVVETAEQAAQLMKLASNGHGQLSLSIPVHEPAKSTEEEVRNFFSAINQNAREFLAGLARHPKGIDAAKLAEELKCDTSVFGGILGGISKNSAKNNFKVKQFVISEMRFEGARRFRHFQPGTMLVKHSSMLGEWMKSEVQKNMGA